MKHKLFENVGGNTFKLNENSCGECGCDCNANGDCDVCNAKQSGKSKPAAPESSLSRYKGPGVPPGQIGKHAPIIKKQVSEGLPMGKSERARKVANALNIIVSNLELPHLSKEASVHAAKIIALYDQEEEQTNQANPQPNSNVGIAPQKTNP